MSAAVVGGRRCCLRCRFHFRFRCLFCKRWWCGGNVRAAAAAALPVSGRQQSSTTGGPCDRNDLRTAWRLGRWGAMVAKGQSATRRLGAAGVGRQVAAPIALGRRQFEAARRHHAMHGPARLIAPSSAPSRRGPRRRTAAPELSNARQQRQQQQRGGPLDCAPSLRSRRRHRRSQPEQAQTEPSELRGSAKDVLLEDWRRYDASATLDDATDRDGKAITNGGVSDSEDSEDDDDEDENEDKNEDDDDDEDDDDADSGNGREARTRRPLRWTTKGGFRIFEGGRTAKTVECALTGGGGSVVAGKLPSKNAAGRPVGRTRSDVKRITAAYSEIPAEEKKRRSGCSS